MRIRPFDPRNLQVLLSWTKTKRDLRMWAGETFRKTPDAKAFRSHLAKPEIMGFEAIDGRGKIIGYAELVTRGNGDAIVCRVIIDPARRGLGAGKSLIRLLSAEAFETHGFRRLLLNVFTLNVPALRCYRAMGFRPVAKRPRPRSYDGQLWDLVVMVKESRAKAA